MVWLHATFVGYKFVLFVCRRLIVFALSAILYALLVLWLHPLSSMLKSTTADLPPVIALANRAYPHE